MRFHRPARRIALGLGAAGIALGSGGLAIAATALIQPAGALSVQVPAVAVREQNVNAAGRIRVALPKTSVGVNGTVDVGNLPENSTGQLEVAPSAAPAPGVPHLVKFGPWVQINNGQTVTVADVTGSGVFSGLHLASSLNGQPGNGLVTVSVDGVSVFSWDVGWANYTGTGGALSGATFAGLDYINYFPPKGLAFGKSLVVTVTNNNGGSASYWADVWYATKG